MMEPLNFTIVQLPNGLWVKERDDGRRGPCVADEAVLWQALQAATGGKPQPAVDVAELVKENERLIQHCQRLADESHQLALDKGSLSRESQRLHTEVEVWSQEYAADVEGLKRQLEALRVENDELRVANEAWARENGRLVDENLHLQANQRKRPGRKPKDASGINITGGVPSEEQVQRLRGEVESDPLDEDL